MNEEWMDEDVCVKKKNSQNKIITLTYYTIGT